MQEYAESRFLTCSGCGASIGLGREFRTSSTGRRFHPRCWRPVAPAPTRPATQPTRRVLSQAELWARVAEVERRSRESSRMCPRPHDPVTE
jgi:hypothetical protein